MSDDGKVVLAVNGEIYNHTKLRENFKSEYKFKTHSDCEVIIPLVRPTNFFYLHSLTVSARATVPRLWQGSL